MRPEDPAGQSGPGSHEGPHDPEVGSLGEEAVKLFGALADLAREGGGGAGAGVSGMAGHAASFAHQVSEHIATGSPECRYCPVCRVVHVLRETSPEVRTHLMVAASSLLQAAAAAMESVPPPGAESGPSRGPEVEHIDLDEPEEPGSSGPADGTRPPEGSS